VNVQFEYYTMYIVWAGGGGCIPPIPPGSVLVLESLDFESRCVVLACEAVQL
jgi:hypothetical protein